MVEIIVDGKSIKASPDATVLQTCLDNGIYIPHLCWMKEMTESPASCRLCFVEISGYNMPVTSCTITPKDNMIINTNTLAVRRLQKTAFQLLMSAHDINCKQCPANKACELQSLAKFLKIGLKPGPYQTMLHELSINTNHPEIELHLNRCVLCGKCIFLCKQKHGQEYLTFAKRGINTIISFYKESENASMPCKSCAACVNICPVRAIRMKTQD